jgi:1-deoxy-D-xylulose-5-phosphate reductoisomerase
MSLTRLDEAASLSILGATGSIGQSTLAIVREVENLSVFALSANTNVQALLAQCLEFKPRYAVICDRSFRPELSAALAEQGSATEVLVGEEGLAQIASAPDVDIVMAAIVGAAGLDSTLAAAG